MGVMAVTLGRDGGDGGVKGPENTINYQSDRNGKGAQNRNDLST